MRMLEWVMWKAWALVPHSVDLSVTFPGDRS
jgi:hypothetical protein